MPLEIKDEFKPDREDEEGGLFEWSDSFRAIGAGIEDFGIGLTNFADFVTADTFTFGWTNTWGKNGGHRFIDDAHTTIGGFVQGMTEFLAGFAFTSGAFKVASLGAGAAGFGKSASVLQKISSPGAKAIKEGAGTSIKALRTKVFKESILADTLKGAIVDFSFIDSQEGRLSDLIQQYPALANPVTQFLASDENDSLIESKLKQALEGAALGVISDSLFHGLRILKAGRKERLAGSPAGAVGDAMEAKHQEIEREGALARTADATEELSRDLPEIGSELSDVAEQISPKSGRREAQQQLADVDVDQARSLGIVPEQELTDEEDLFLMAVDVNKTIDDPGHTIGYRKAMDTAETGKTIKPDFDAKPDMVTSYRALLRAESKQEQFKAISKIRYFVGNDVARMTKPEREDAVANAQWAIMWALGETGGNKRSAARKLRWGYRDNMSDAARLEVDKKVIGNAALLEGNMEDLKDIFGEETIRLMKIDLGPEEPIVDNIWDIANEDELISRFGETNHSEIAEIVRAIDAANSVLDVVRGYDMDYRKYEDAVSTWWLPAPKAVKESITSATSAREAELAGKPLLVPKIRQPKFVPKDLEGKQEALDWALLRTVSGNRTGRQEEVLRTVVSTLRQLYDQIQTPLGINAGTDPVLGHHKATPIEKMMGHMRKDRPWAKTFEWAIGSILSTPSNLIRDSFGNLMGTIFSPFSKIAGALIEKPLSRIIAKTSQGKQIVKQHNAALMAGNKKIKDIESEIKVLRISLLEKGGVESEIKLKELQADRENLADSIFPDDSMEVSEEVEALYGELQGLEAELYTMRSKVDSQTEALSQSLRAAGEDTDVAVAASVLAQRNGLQQAIDELGATANIFAEFINLGARNSKTFMGAFESATSGMPRLVPHRVHELSDLRGKDGSIVASAFQKSWFGLLLEQHGQQSLADTMAKGFGTAGKILRLSPNVMLFSDALSKEIIVRSNAISVFKREGVKLGYRGQALDNHITGKIDEFIVNGQAFPERMVSVDTHPDDVAGHLYAQDQANRQIHRAGEFTFTREPEGTGVIDRATRGIMKFRETLPIMKMFIPFVKTSGNILNFADDRTREPVVAAAKFIYEEMRRMLPIPDVTDAFGTQKSILPTVSLRKSSNRTLRQISSPNKAERLEALERVATAFGFWTVGLTLAQQGLTGSDTDGVAILGSGPIDKGQNRLWQQAGNRPYSFRVNGKYISYDRLGPLGPIFGLMADATQYSHFAQKDEDTGIAAMAIHTVSETFVNRSYATSMNILLQALTSGDEDRVLKAIGRVGGMFIPSALKGAADRIDPTMVEARGIMDAMMSRVPGLKGNVLPRRNALGEKITHVDYADTNYFTSTWTPFPISNTDFADPVVAEMSLLGKPWTAINRNMRIGGIDIDMHSVQTPDGQDGLDYMRELSGTVAIRGRTMREDLIELFGSERYSLIQNTPEGTQAKIDLVSNVISAYRARAKRTFIEEFQKQLLPQTSEDILFK